MKNNLFRTVICFPRPRSQLAPEPTFTDDNKFFSRTSSNETTFGGDNDLGFAAGGEDSQNFRWRVL